ncbi:MAG: glycosyltransferase [Candidatus Cloacimonetes bacterium]|nr:glycosyltransferase [Candidatus Cloacimonadota bacterium]
MTGNIIRDILFTILLVLIGSGFVTYVLFSIRFYYGYKRYKPMINHKKKSVSVIIAARNEAENLRKLLLCLINQKYPKELYEVIVADDDSEDDTEKVVTAFVDHDVKIIYLKVDDRDEVVSPKKNALTKAISIASGEIILTTDADCLVPDTWIGSMISSFFEGVDMVAGYSRTYLRDWHTASLLNKYEHFDFACTYMVLGGGYTIGKSWACIGQNLAYRKTAFFEVGGFEKIKHLISGDDVNLMQLMRRQGMKIIFNFDPQSFVYTSPVRDLKHLLSQRTRWASNMKYQLKFDPEFFFILLSMAFMYWGVLALALFNWKLALILFTARVLFENIFIGNTRKRFGINGKMAWFYPIWLVFQTVFLVLTMLLGQFNLFVWHGKKPYKRNRNAVNHI